MPPSWNWVAISMWLLTLPIFHCELLHPPRALEPDSVGADLQRDILKHRVDRHLKLANDYRVAEKVGILCEGETPRSKGSLSHWHVRLSPMGH